MEGWLPQLLAYYERQGLKEVPVSNTTSSELAETVLMLTAFSI